jgi:hypothetical protein
MLICVAKAVRGRQLFWTAGCQDSTNFYANEVPIRLWKCPSHCATGRRPTLKLSVQPTAPSAVAKMGERSGTWAEGDRLRSQVLGWLVIVKGSKCTARLENISFIADSSLTFFLRRRTKLFTDIIIIKNWIDSREIIYGGGGVWHRTSPVASPKHSIRRCIV